MSGKSQERATNQSSVDLDAQTVHHNSYEPVHDINNTNVNQEQQVVYENDPEEAPPAYDTTIKFSPSDPTPKRQQNQPVDNVIQNSSSINQGTPFPPGHKWPRLPTRAVCPHCGARGLTHVKTSSTVITFILAILLFLLCFCLFIIPFFITSCKKTTHYCSSCNAVIAEIPEFQ